jgi:hypothetical protein
MNLESNMTDKTPQNKADIPVKTPTARAGTGTTDVTRNSGPQSRALPEAGALKERFKAGSIPLQTDFADLIDLANMGRQAVGGAEGQTGPADGFTLSSTGRLELKPNTDKGISVDKDGVAVRVNTSNGLKMTSSGIAINDGLGIEFSSTGQLNLKVMKDGGFSGGPGGAHVIPGKGITTDSSGVGVKAGNGIAVTSNGVNVKLSKGTSNDNGGGGQGSDGNTSGGGGGLVITSNGLSVDAGSGIQIDSKGVSIKLTADSGLSADETNGLKVKVDSGIKISNGAVIIDQSKVLPRGIITMFSGSQVPDGWAFCDGNNGTPNLINRFIMAGYVEQVGGKSSNIFQGDINSKVFSFSSDSQTVRVKGSTKGHALTADENGKHIHEQGETLNLSTMCHNGNTTDWTQRDWVNGGSSQGNPPKYRPYTFESGKGTPHMHDLDLTSESHTHNNKVSVPYYILAFIMKL